LCLGTWWISRNGKLARMIRDAVSKLCWFSCGGSKENMSWILRRAEDKVVHTFELLVTISQAMQSHILASQKTWIFLDVMNENLKSPDLVTFWYFSPLQGFVPGIFGVSHGAIQFMTYEEMKNTYNQYRMVPIDTKLVSVIRIINDWTTENCCFQTQLWCKWISDLFYIEKWRHSGEASALSRAKVSCAGYHGSFFKRMERSLWCVWSEDEAQNGHQSLVLWWGRRPHGHTTVMQSLGVKGGVKNLRSWWVCTIWSE